MFKCNKCKKEFSAKWEFNRHISRKTPCQPIVENNVGDPLACKFCGRKFSQKSTLNRHIKRSCVVYKNQELLFEHVANKKKEDEKKMRKIQEENAKLKRKLKKASKSSSSSISENSVNNNAENINNTNNNTNNNINNTTIINNHINITASMTSFDHGSMRSVINEFMDSKSLKAEDFLSMIKSYLRKNNVEELAKIVLMTLHNNPDIPNGQNLLHCNSGPYEGTLLSYQHNGWSETDVKYMTMTILGEICQIVGRMGYDENHKNTQKCVDTFNSGAFVEEYCVDLLEVVKKFDKSKKEPPKNVNEKKMIQSRIDEEKKKKAKEEQERRIEELRKLSLERANEEDSEERSPMDSWEKQTGIKLPKSLNLYKEGESIDDRSE